MKRTALLFTTLLMAMLVFALHAMAQISSSVPNLLDFQGKLTTPAGNPVANGPHSFVFRIYDAPVGGTLLWSEGPVAISTTGGLFTHQLGSSTALPQTLFQDNTGLWLEVEADAAIITPRTQLISNPHTRVANNLEVESPYVPGQAAVRSEPGNHGLSTYGMDGLEQIRLWGPSWGEMYLYDASPSNFLNFAAIGDNFPGGALYLGDGAGLYPLILWGGVIGDAAATLPADAINAGEMLNEPGIASTYKNLSISMLTPATNYDTISITVPTAGYIVVNAYGVVELVHVNGTSTVVRFYVSKTSGVVDFDNFSIHSQPSGSPTGSYHESFAITKVEAVAAGTHTYYLVGDEFSGNGFITRPRITAMFFPTNYGTVVSTKPVVSRAAGNVATSLDAAGTGLPSEVEVITVEDSKARLEAERAQQMAELEARIKKLEEAAKSGKQQVVDDNR
ncbi:MAG TPA: hypothetical protein VNL73_10130 [Verrucomicrobiae bacterium]|nr:hypothetical protein [Verrucomicrobiae bacterium]